MQLLYLCSKTFFFPYGHGYQASLFAPQLILSPGRVNNMTSTSGLENAHKITFLRPDLKNRTLVNCGQRTHQPTKHWAVWQGL